MSANDPSFVGPSFAAPEPHERRVLRPEDATKGMVRHRVEIDPKEVVFVKSLVEASEGLASIFADHGGSLTIATPPARARALAELLSDLEADHGARVFTEQHDHGAMS